MDFWTAIVAIVAIIFGTQMISVRHKNKMKAKDLDENSIGKLEELERRIESLETLIIELEKDKKFRDL